MGYHNAELIVMLTYNDYTVENAFEVFEQCKNSKAKFYGFKEKGLSLEKMKTLYSYMNEYGKTTFLEVVAYTEEEGLRGARLAVDCGCDILIGTIFFDSINEFCKENSLKYMPFVGNVTNRPSILEGTIEGMINQANCYIEKGIYGFDLLGYRYAGNQGALIEEFISQVDAPVCVAGSIDSYEKLDEVQDAGPWAFTIGGAFFENKFGGTHSEQINKVCEYVALQREAILNA